ncbi:LexA-binding, inner membrane-associated putative hydrolase [Halomicrobium zhouii]|uniref:LexA-binding, inner membrane-associated putative hydrolase n=1 Tax=Halomicrobium zhouii TaxID=767519 RepID=A0A1I6K8H6_9EURY|nr:metal-dependent hydrolase [Halomicrobium zhouii]SFR87512.1 LexA-binding, inner membrane-associated putative hydrolase [Halomicrobium zhouii]
MHQDSNRYSSMMPWGHFAVAFLPFLTYRLLRQQRLPSRRVTVFLFVATQLPDLIDKPLAWGLHVLPSGRSFAHSLLFAVPLVIAVTIFLTRGDRATLGALFTFGYLSHVFADIYDLLLTVPPDQWQTTYVASLYWPLVAIPAPEPMPFVYYFTRISPTRYAQGSLGLALFAAFFFYPELAAAVGRRQSPVKLPTDEEPTAANER